MGVEGFRPLRAAHEALTVGYVVGPFWSGGEKDSP
jgi:hypothetical protein